MSCILVAATTITLAWCPAAGPVNHYKVFATDDPVDPIAVTDDATPRATFSCPPGRHRYHVIAYEGGMPTEWMTMRTSPPSIDSDELFCDLGMDADRDGRIGGPDFGLFTQGFGCEMQQPPPLECDE